MPTERWFIPISYHFLSCLIISWSVTSRCHFWSHSDWHSLPRLPTTLHLPCVLLTTTAFQQQVIVTSWILGQFHSPNLCWSICCIPMFLAVFFSQLVTSHYQLPKSVVQQVRSWLLWSTRTSWDTGKASMKTDGCVSSWTTVKGVTLQGRSRAPGLARVMRQVTWLALQPQLE